MANENEENELQQQLKRIKMFFSSKNLHSVTTLPQEMVIEILLRLPVECLLRCMSVCKPWYSLISDSHFVNCHLKMSTNNNDYMHHRLMLGGLGDNMKSCSLYDVIHNKSINPLELDYPFKDTWKSVRIVGSCRGLLCLRVGEDDPYIWNPSTRRLNRLSYCGIKEPLYSFGYDESSEDYKVVAISDSLQSGTKVRMYSLKSAKWKKIGDFPGVPFDGCGKFLNGSLHWTTKSNFNSVYPTRIVSLNLATTTYGEVLLPVHHDGDIRVEALGKWLFLVCYYWGNDADVWVMNVYGDPNSWIKLVCIENGNQFWRYPIPCFANDSIILLKCGSKNILYDVESGSSSNIKNYGGSLEVLPWTIVESLVSPGGPQRYSRRRRQKSCNQDKLE